MRYTHLTLAGIVIVSVAACGSHVSNSPAASGPSTSAAPTSSTPPAKPKDHVTGLVSSVSGTTVQVAQKDGSVTVDFATSTRITSLVPASLTDVATGSCVAVHPTRDSNAGSGPVTAATVQIATTADGQCPSPHGEHEVVGTVSSVSGNTITLTANGGSSQTSVTVSNDTRYAKRIPANAQAISQGECLSANGTKDNAGALQATSITVRPARNGSCPGSRK